MMVQGATLQKALDVLRTVCGPEPGHGIQAALAGPPINVPVFPAVLTHDPEAWRTPFVEWLDLQCALHQRAFSGLVSLHLAFGEWEHSRGGVPCARETFAALLAELGFLMGEIEGTVLVSGLILKEDAAEYSLSKRRGFPNDFDSKQRRR